MGDAKDADITDKYVDNQCKCAMTEGKKNDSGGLDYEGYCSLMLGTVQYKKAVSALVNLLS